MKPIFLIFLFFACSNIASDQKASHYNNKGITCDGIEVKGQTIICGETSVYTSEKAGNGIKDAFLVMSPDFGKSNQAYSMNYQNVPSRFEKIIPFENDLVIGGFYGESKNKLLIRTNDKGAAIWGVQSEKYRTFDPGDMAMNPAGDIFMVTKDPASEAYHGTVHLFDKDGNCKWSKDMSSIEIMQDIIATKDGHFLISYKQKGAYIDGSTRKKYWMNSFHKIDQSGEIMWSRKFHLDNELVDECVFSKVLEDKSGNLYFIGKIDLLKPRKQHPFITKTDKEGKVFWSYVYDCTPELNFKSGCFDATGNLILVADGYAKNGGISFMQMAPDGNVLWAKMTKTANYEQAISVFPTKNGFEIIWDKLLNFASFTINQKGQCCSAKTEELAFTRQKFPIQLDDFKGNWETVQAEWKKMEFKLTPHSDVTSTSDCK